MNSYKQLLCIIFSFGYGVLTYYFYCLLLKMVSRINIIFKILFALVSLFLLSVLYVFIVYKINYGIINIYFYFLIGSGFIIANVKKRKI